MKLKRETKEFNNMFWEKMNVLAIQNISLQQIKMA